MRQKIMATCFLLVVSSTVFATEINSFDNVKWKLVSILNKHIESGNTEYGLKHIEVVPVNGHIYINNICGIGNPKDSQFNNKVKIIGQLSDGDYIFEYTREGIAYGTLCPSGVFFKAKLEYIVD